jgi:hypothetical protein
MNWTQEEINQYNEKCANLICAEFDLEDYRYTFQQELVDTEYTLSKSKRHHREQLCFHSDWNWIMEVIEAIEKLGFNFNIYHQDCLIEKDKKFIVVTHATKLKTKKEAVVSAINDFLIWYNENKK